MLRNIKPVIIEERERERKREKRIKGATDSNV